jgi:urate oxidase / 2-oxo-4-hydroxy-4-carboxy-5-ureidoimidazoline decarboxylase
MKFSYGKEAVSVYRAGAGALFAAEIRLDAFGQSFEPSYTEGDNSMVIATDSMKNFIHATAAEYDEESLEGFVELVARTFLETYAHVESVHVAGREIAFSRAGDVVFRRVGPDRDVTELRMDRTGIRDHRSGREGLHLVKLTGSAFRGFIRDEYTTLPDADDRPLGIQLNVYWRCADFARRVASDGVVASLAATFDEFFNESIQQLVREMGVRVLDGFADIVELSFDAENRLWDRAALPAGDGPVRIYTDPRPPYGVITLTLRR